MRICVAVLGFAAIVLGSLSKANVIPIEWASEPALLIAAGAIAFVEALIGIFASHTNRSGLEREMTLEKTVKAALISVSRATNTNVITLGGSVFAVRRGGFRRRKLLYRLVRSRLSDSPQESVVKWTAGKGAIGDAWEQKKTIHREWIGVARKYGTAEITRESFDRIPAKTRDGFSFEDFRIIAGKYAEILAVPILAKSKCVGVLAIDIPFAGQESECLGSREVKEIAETCAQVLSKVIR